MIVVGKSAGEQGAGLGGLQDLPVEQAVAELPGEEGAVGMGDGVIPGPGLAGQVACCEAAGGGGGAGVKVGRTL